LHFPLQQVETLFDRAGVVPLQDRVQRIGVSDWGDAGDAVAPLPVGRADVHAGPAAYIELSEPSQGRAPVLLIVQVSFGGMMLKKQAVLIVLILLVVEIDFRQHAAQVAGPSFPVEIRSVMTGDSTGLFCRNGAWIGIVA